MAHPRKAVILRHEFLRFRIHPTHRRPDRNRDRLDEELPIVSLLIAVGPYTRPARPADQSGKGRPAAAAPPSASVCQARPPAGAQSPGSLRPRNTLLPI